jgi:hypothetical protein
VAKQQVKQPKPALYCLYRISGEPELDIGKQNIDGLDVEYKIFVSEELDAAKLRGWFRIESVRQAIADNARPAKADGDKPYPTDDKNALAEWAEKNLGITLDKRKAMGTLLAEVEEANANRD